MYEINTSTLLLIGIDNNKTKVYTSDDEFIINDNSKNIINNSCGYFGSTLVEQDKKTSRITGFKTKLPIIIEETRSIIFFPLRSTRENVNIWISFNNLDKYEKRDRDTVLFFKCGKSVKLDFSYYIVDNQVTRCIMLDYICNQKRKSL